MEGPANTLSYFIAGYSIILLVLAAYLVSLVVRFRNLKQDVQTLEELEKDQPIEEQRAEARS